MGWPTWSGPGNPVTPGDPTSEGINQYGSQGLYGSRGSGSRIRYENPDFGNVTYNPNTGAFVLPPIRVEGTNPLHIPEMGRYVAPAEPRDPFVPVLDVAPTPIPSSDLVRVSPPRSQPRQGPRGERKRVPQRSSPSTPGLANRRGSFWLFKGGFHGRA